MKLLIFGITPFASMVAHSFETRAARDVVAYVVHRRFIPPDWHNSRPLVAFEDLDTIFDPNEHEIFVALEHARHNLARSQIAAEACEKGYRLASFVDPSANIARRTSQ